MTRQRTAGQQGVNSDESLVLADEGLVLAKPAGRLHLFSGIKYEFLEEKRSTIAASSVTWYDENLSLVGAWLQEHEGIGHLEALTKANLIHFFGAMRESVKPDTAHGYYRAIRALLRWVRAEDAYELHPSLFDANAKFRVPEPAIPAEEDRQYPRYSEEQIKAIFEEIRSKPARGRTRERDQMILATYLGSGIRLAELVGLTVDAIEADGEGNSYLHVLGKGNKWRWVAISTKVRRDLERYVSRYRPESSSTRIFLTMEGEPLKRRGVQIMIRRLEDRLGFEIHPHALRHNYGTYYASQPNANVAKLQKQLGHRKLATTMKYVHMNRADQAEGVEDFSPL